MKRAAWCFCVLFSALVIPSRAWADHFPAWKLARGRPEHVLGLVNVYRDTIDIILARLGKPLKSASTTSADYPAGSGERTYEWSRDGVRLRLSTEFKADRSSGKVIESAPVTVDIWGRSGGRLGCTGEGICLGDQLSHIEKVYGHRSQRGSQSLIFQWRDQTTLVIDFDHEQRAIHMQLLPDVE